MITLVLGLALLAGVTPVDANDEFAPSWRSFPGAVSVKLEFDDPNDFSLNSVSGADAGAVTVSVPGGQEYGEAACTTSSGGVVHSGASRVIVTNLAEPGEGLIVRAQLTTDANPLEADFVGFETATGLFGTEDFEGCAIQEELAVVASLPAGGGLTTHYFEAILTEPGECSDIHFFVEGAADVCIDEVIFDIHRGINPGQKVVANIAPTSAEIVEGSSTTMVVSLDPNLGPVGSDVNVLLDPDNSGVDITFNGLNPHTLTFTSGNWTTPQTVTVAAIDDGNFELCSEVINFQAQVTSSVTSFNGGAAQSALAFTINEINSGCVIATATAELEEITGGSTGTIEYVLNRVPSSGTVTVDITDGFEDPNAPFFTADPNVITFTTGNWSVPQTVTLTAIQDDELRGDGGGELTETTAVSTVTAVGDIFFTENPAAIPVTISEDECGALEFDQFDLDENCAVDVADLSSLISEWLTCTEPGC